MQPSPRQGATSGDPSSIAVEDARTADAVLAFVLAEHPSQLTISELTRELSGGATDFDKSDAIESAVRDLAGSGLLHYHGDFVVPSRAAVRFNRITPTGDRHVTL